MQCDTTAEGEALRAYARLTTVFAGNFVSTKKHLHEIKGIFAAMAPQQVVRVFL
jgi:hypothetical protein